MHQIYTTETLTGLLKVAAREWSNRREKDRRQRAVNELYDSFDLDTLESGSTMRITTRGSLVLDDIGVQRGNKNEEVVLFQIVDNRLSNRKPVGMLTNLDATGLTEMLGVRIMDRMTMDGGMWVNFDWFSYRKQVKS